MEKEKAELLERWRHQQTALQRRGSSLGAALRQIDSTENHMVDFNDRLDRYLRHSKDISGFTLASANILRDIKVRGGGTKLDIFSRFMLSVHHEDFLQITDQKPQLRLR